jgi:DMSO/TMAO reductase YedYZ molybdopterin-dependent catalytic subunit
MDAEKIKRVTSSDTIRENRVPPGQFVANKWPALHFDGIPAIDIKSWRFRAFGLVEGEKTWNWEEFRSLPVTEVFADWHCVTTWSILGMTMTGVIARDVVDQLKVRPEAEAVMVHSYDGYTTNLLMRDFLEEDVIFTWAVDGEELSREHGWPLRLMVPKLYAWKSAKWVSGIEFMAKDAPGYWEQRGYHMHGDPWTEERYS